MKLAIVIPYYKKQFFAQTLDSLKKQTDQRFNIYIGNDASPEDPKDLIQEYLSDRQYEYFEYPTNLGGKNLAEQWERVIDETKGEEWIMILGDDDYLSDNVIESFHNHLKEVDDLNINLIKYSQQLVDDNNKFYSYRTSHPKIYSTVKFYIDRTYGRSRNSISENIFRYTAYKKYKFKKYPLAWPSDDMAWLQFTDFGNLYFIEDATFYIHSGNFNISGKNDKQDIKGYGACLFYKDIFLNYEKHFPKKELFKFLRFYENTSKKYNLPIEINLNKYYLKYGGILPWLLSIRRKLLNN
ncbi:glycosyltransferase family 2 protein [Apibacter sp. HY039]|uniref:glycosyltransferase family 2 protein n=1 Tax=Apibacter sp. HY039 TaxID=2501476 RepID=UPI000FEBC685|nr:glycosyltransferase family 2 protein [Apibacter sp. HY039]